MKYIVTGTDGFIGNAVKKELTNLGHYILEINQDSTYRDEIKIEGMVKNCDGIFHIGAISDTSLHDSRKMLYWNYTTSTILFNLARKHNKKVVYSSSAANYGSGDGIPNNIYGWSKLLAEDYGLKACERFVALRYFNVYGPGEEHKGKMASVAYQAWKAGKMRQETPMPTSVLEWSKRAQTIPRTTVYRRQISMRNAYFYFGCTNQSPVSKRPTTASN